MSYLLGNAAINLEMTDRVPRTEFSADNHWGLVSAATGITVSHDSPPEVRHRAAKEFRKVWDYSFIWHTAIHGGHLVGRKTYMGHGVYADGGGDYNDHVFRPFTEPEEVFAFDPWAEYGTVDEKAAAADFEHTHRLLVADTPDALSTTGIYVTCVSGLIEMFGWETLLLAAGIDPVKFGDVTDRYCGWVSQYFRALAASNVPVVMIHDDFVWAEGAIFHPDWYRRYVFPNYRRMFTPLIESGKRIIFTSDGNFTRFIDDVAGCGVHGFCMEPLTDMAYVAEKYGKTHVFIGNADTRILLGGTRDDIRREVKRCMDIGKKYPGFIMAVGNHIPPNTPVDSALYYNECVEEMGRR